MLRLFSEKLSILPPKRAAHIIIGLSCLALFYHALIVSSVIPYKYVWGGKIESTEQLWQFEALSIMLNLGMIYLALSSVKIIHYPLPEKSRTILLWFFAGLLFFNTLGNLAAEELFEILIFTPMTAIMSVLFARLALASSHTTSK